MKRKKITSQNLCFMIKELFSPAHIINANNDKDIQNQQMLLNSLEAKDNEIRAIFAVDKLNEGWDVLNLFNIVRLNKSAIIPTTKDTKAHYKKGIVFFDSHITFFTFSAFSHRLSLIFTYFC